MPDGNDAAPSDKMNITPESSDGDSATSRRGYLKAAGAAIGSAALFASQASADDHDVLSIDGDQGKAAYQLSVSGELEKSTDFDASNSNSNVWGTTAVGRVEDSTDSYRITGEITDFTFLYGTATLYLNGQQISRSELLHETPHDELSNTLEVRGVEGTVSKYEASVSGEIEPHDELGTVNWSDDIDDDAVEGYVYGDGVDAYRFSGELTSFQLVGDADVYLNGDRIGDDGSTDVEFSIASLTETFTHYAIEVTADDTPTAVTEDDDVEDRLLAEEDDTVTELDDDRYRIEGQTGTSSGSPPAYGDTFRWETAEEDWGILGFSYEGASESDLTITINGESVAPSELPELESESDPVDTGPAIGGGEGYSNTVPRSEASVVVSTESELVNALGSASSGDVVYVRGDATITTDRRLTVPSGVTLASDRGIDGSDGGVVRVESTQWPFISVGDDTRITGVEISGPHTRHESNSGLALSIGIDAEGRSGVEIDNCDISGFRYAGIRAGGDTHIHHSHVHHCALAGYGYGVATNVGHPIIEYNYINYTRHGVMSNGENGYTCRYNRFGPDAVGHVIDVHEPGGTTTEIYNNTVEAETYHSDASASWYASGEPVIQVMIQGVPDDAAEIYDNWFYNPNDPEPSSTGDNESAIVQNGTDEWTSVEYSGNHYGTDEPENGVGHPR